MSTKHKFKVGDRVRLDGVILKLYQDDYCLVSFRGNAGCVKPITERELSHARLVRPKRRVKRRAKG